jgi:glycosyltransferase involved in cell wall biosynthesis
VPWRDIASAVRLRHIVRSFAPDVLHLHASKAGMLGRLLFGHRERPVVVYQPHGFSFLRRRGAYAALYQVLEHRAARLADACLVVSLAERDGTRRKPVRWHTRMEVVPNIVEVEPVSPDRVRDIRRRLQIAESELLAVYVGMLLPGKLVEDLIRATRLARAQGRGWHAVIVGDGPRRHTLQRLTRELGAEAYVHWPGFQLDVQDWMAAADCVVHPSQFEAFGLSIAEAMTSGRPVIASDIPAARELVSDGVTGVFYPPGDAAALAAHLTAFADHPERLARLGEAGGRSAERFSPATVARVHLRLYRDLLGAREE